MRIYAALAALLILLSLCGCAQPQLPAETSQPTLPPSTDNAATEASSEPDTQPVTEPEYEENTTAVTEVSAGGLYADQAVLPVGTSLCGVALDGLTIPQAFLLVNTTLDNYRLSLDINEQNLHLTGEEMGVACNKEAFESWAYNCLAGQSSDPGQLWSCDETMVRQLLRRHLETPAQNVYIEYSQKAKRFITVSAVVGTSINTKQAMGAINSAVSTLSPTATTTVDSYVLLPELANDCALLPEATQIANSYLDLEISYTYAPSGKEPYALKLSKEVIASFLIIDENFNVSINEAAIRGYVAAMAGSHGVEAAQGNFITTAGTVADRTVKYYEATIDQEAMFNHLIQCLQEKKSASSSVPYVPCSTDLPYGGNYVEVSLTDQQLWIYQNGNVAATTAFVSGHVPSGAWTGGGVFQVEDKDTTCWLIGSTFRDYVHYWIGFDGKIGIHDACWRSDFGNRIYLYDGSHGCINIPLWNARQVYDGLALDSYVIVHGGKIGAEAVAQEFTGVDSYELTTQSAPFALDVMPIHPGTELVYRSSDPRVVNISPSGLVTVIGPGKATITVISNQLGMLQAAKHTVDITVFA